MTESSDLQNVLPMKWLAIPRQKINIILYAVPLTVPILRSTENIKKLCEVQCLQMYQFLW